MNRNNLAPVFVAWLEEVAAEHGKTVEQVYEWWREYAAYCRAGDQSPVQFEFLNWYGKKLAA